MDKIQLGISLKQRLHAGVCKADVRTAARPVFVLGLLVLILSEIRWAHMNHGVMSLGVMSSFLNLATDGIFIHG